MNNATKKEMNTTEEVLEYIETVNHFDVRFGVHYDCHSVLTEFQTDDVIDTSFNNRDEFTKDIHFDYESTQDCEQSHVYGEANCFAKIPASVLIKKISSESNPPANMRELENMLGEMVGSCIYHETLDVGEVVAIYKEINIQPEQFTNSFLVKEFASPMKDEINKINSVVQNETSPYSELNDKFAAVSSELEELCSDYDRGMEESDVASSKISELIEEWNDSVKNVDTKS